MNSYNKLVLLATVLICCVQGFHNCYSQNIDRNNVQTRAQETYSACGNLVWDMTGIKHNDKQTITLFSITGAVPNSLFNFSLYAAIGPDQNGPGGTTPGYWYEALVRINGQDAYLINPPSTNALPLTFNYENHTMRANGSGQILIELINIHTRVWPTVVVASTFQSGTRATLSYIQNP